ncbi:MAG: iron-containing alcohol dehydrogenase [Collinsella sp.]|nr:iron-containing alcohol dehydrogenase [Collinsella sp.]
MNPIRSAYCRAFQACFRAALPALPYREPVILDGLDKVAGALGQRDVSRVLLVTDPGIVALHLADGLVASLSSNGIDCAVFGDTVANPTVDNVEEALARYRERGCQAIIGFGGGSAMDCAKAVAARVARPRKSLAQMRGLLRVRRRCPLLVAVPTTAGTGSEVTLAAVITDAREHHKYVINDFSLIPRIAVHDYRVTLALPPAITATTGMDALTHAIEAYIGRTTTAYTRACAEEAVAIIHRDLERAYLDPGDIDARRGMLLASYRAGVAFTRSYVGYVHGIAHSLGGCYGLAHGLANAVVLPHVLRAYGRSCERSLARLARLVGLVDAAAGDAAGAEALISWIEGMNERMGIPRHIDCIRGRDVPQMVAHCDAECNPLYPVPRLMDRSELGEMYRVVAGGRFVDEEE